MTLLLKIFIFLITGLILVGMAAWIFGRFL